MGEETAVEQHSHQPQTPIRICFHFPFLAVLMVVALPTPLYCPVAPQSPSLCETNPWRRDLGAQSPQRRRAPHVHALLGSTHRRTHRGSHPTLPEGPGTGRGDAGSPTCPPCRHSCRWGRAPGQSPAPTATAAGRAAGGCSPSLRGCVCPPVRAFLSCGSASSSSQPWFLPEETREEASQPHARGVEGRRRQGMPQPCLFLTFAAKGMHGTGLTPPPPHTQGTAPTRHCPLAHPTAP